MSRAARLVAVVAVAVGAFASPAGAQAPVEPPDHPRHVSADGSAVAFTTEQALTAADTDTSYDVYVSRSGTLELVSGGSGPQGVFDFTISEDGSRVLFHTDEQLVAADTDSRTDVYVRDGSTLELVSTGPADPGGSGPQDIGGIWRAEATPDLGSIFFSTVQRLVAADTDDQRDIYRHETGGSTTLVSTTPAGVTPGDHWVEAVSEDGSKVIDWTDEAMVAADQDANEDLYEIGSGSPVFVSTSGTDPHTGFTAFRHMTPDGGSIVFQSSDPLGPRDLDAQVDLYQRIGGTTRLVSANGNGYSLPCENPVNPTRGENCVPRTLDQSDDGGHVLFSTTQALAPGDATGTDVYDRAWPATRWLTGSVTAGSGGEMGDVSADGSRSVVESRAKLVGADTDGAADIYAWEGGSPQLLSGGGATDARFARTTPDARTVVFETDDALVPADTDAGHDLYVESGSGPQLVTTGPADDGTDFQVWFLGLSDDGDRVFFSTGRSLVAADTDSRIDVYMREGGTTTLISG